MLNESEYQILRSMGLSDGRMTVVKYNDLTVDGRVVSSRECDVCGPIDWRTNQVTHEPHARQGANAAGLFAERLRASSYLSGFLQYGAPQSYDPGQTALLLEVREEDVLYVHNAGIEIKAARLLVLDRMDRTDPRVSEFASYWGRRWSIDSDMCRYIGSYARSWDDVNQVLGSL